MSGNIRMLIFADDIVIFDETERWIRRNSKWYADTLPGSDLNFEVNKNKAKVMRCDRKVKIKIG